MKTKSTTPTFNWPNFALCSCCLVVLVRCCIGMAILGQYNIIRRLSPCTEANAFSKSTILMYEDACHLLDSSAMLRSTKILSSLLLPVLYPACNIHPHPHPLPALLIRSMNIRPSTLLTPSWYAYVVFGVPRFLLPPRWGGVGGGGGGPRHCCQAVVVSSDEPSRKRNRLELENMR